MSNVFFISGFNGSEYVINEEDKIINSLEKQGIIVNKLNYYSFYKIADSRNIIEEITNNLIQNYYNNGEEQLNLVGWSLGGCILIEVLNIISSINEQLPDDEKIKVGKVILFSPAWYIIDIKNFLSSFVDSKFYDSKDIEKINKKSENSSILYLAKNPLAILHLFKLSNFSKNKNNYVNNQERESDGGLSILKDFDTTLIIPKNDKYVNVSKILKVAKELGINFKIIGNYGHMSPVMEEVINEVTKDVYKR